MTATTAENYLQLDGVSFGYSEKEVLSDIDLNVRSGRVYGLIGPNGSGKTSLVNLLCGTRRPDRGVVRLLGSPLSAYSKKQLARHLSLVPQEFTLGFDYRVRDIVFMGRHPHIGRFSSPSLDDHELVNRAMAEMDIESLADRPVTELSGGEKQRVVVARALAQDTATMILDEATSNLDIRHTLEIMRVLKKRVSQSGLCVIAAIHDLNLAASFCDEFIILKNGQLVSCGPVEHCLNRELIREVFEVEADVIVDSESSGMRIHYPFNRTIN
ncbi:MAG: ABC transporter ATP-binding protein [Thermodesulfobacteriota bacterium]